MRLYARNYGINSCISLLSRVKLCRCSCAYTRPECICVVLSCSHTAGTTDTSSTPFFSVSFRVLSYEERL